MATKLEITSEVTQAVKVALRQLRGRVKGRPALGVEWDDIEQDAYLRILNDDKFDPALGTVGARVHSFVTFAYKDAVRSAEKRPEVTNWLDIEYSGVEVDGEYIPRQYLDEEPEVPDDTSVNVDAQDYVDSLDAEDRAVVTASRNNDLPPRNSPERRKYHRTLNRLRKSVIE